MKNQVNSLALILTATVSMALGAGMMYWKNKERLEFTDKYSAMLDIQDLMKNTDVGLPDDVDTVDVYNAYLSLYGDDYTRVNDMDIGSSKFITSQVNTSSTALGSGFEINVAQDEDQLLVEVTKVEEGMAADKAGLKAGDRIVKIGGTDITKSEPTAARDIMGKEGTELDLTVLREGQYENISFARVTDKDSSRGIKSELIDGVLYIKIEEFSLFNSGLFAEQFDGREYDSLLIDLRENEGGDLGVALDMAALITQLPSVTLHYKSGKTSALESNVDIESIVDEKISIAVLVNEKTASAAEAMTVILKDARGADIVGMTTFGKSSFQEDGFINGYSIRYTSGYVLIGDRPNYNGVGITPDIEVKMDPDLIGTEDDVQLQKALEILG
ncbi:MAG: PDZ domain-containing protein [Ruminococcus sp.]|nr:PDZ domain-containing protein [Ruminococcus sp.]